MAGKRLTRHGASREKVSPEQSLAIKKRGGKRFALTRIDAGPANFNGQMDQIFREIPAEGKPVKTNLARVVLEDRE